MGAQSLAPQLLDVLAESPSIRDTKGTQKGSVRRNTVASTLKLEAAERINA